MAPQTHKLTFTLSDETHQKLREICQADRRTQSNMICNLIEDHHDKIVAEGTKQ